MRDAPPAPFPGSDSTHHLTVTDRVGAFAGVLCAIHCAATVPLAGLLSSSQVARFLGHGSELVFFTVAVLLVLASSIHGYRHHRSIGILCGFALSFALWVAGSLFATGTLESVLHVSAAVGLATTHLVSLKRLRSCSH
jgi:hypothetical protein